MKRFATVTLFCLISLAIISCKTKKEELPAIPARLIFKFKFDSTQARLNNLGQPSTLASGHAAQCPIFKGMSSHYIELAQSDYTAVGAGTVLYHAPETSAGGSTAIHFDSSKVVGNGEEFFSIPLKDVAAGSYKWLRVSLAYQKYDIKYKIYIPALTSDYYDDGTLASFIGYNTYINSYKINNETISVNDDKLQGYWGFETELFGTTYTSTGQSAGTTVPNPISSTSPIPAGSCLVTGQFNGHNLEITGNETSDIIVTVSLSTNDSFEWDDTTPDGWYQPGPPANEVVTDMGIRGLIPYIE
jgi:hypothetical protein